MRRRLGLLLLLLALAPAPRAAELPPRNVILMIGDGMGFGQLALARVAKGGRKLRMDSMPITGMLRTSPVGAVVPDSAATATAMATGYNTRNGRIGQRPNGEPVLTVIEAAEGLGRSTGLVTTTSITHATPAGFATHVRQRWMEPEIARQLVDGEVDVLMGGGRGFFLPSSSPGSARPDGKDLEATARANGFLVVHSREAMAGADSSRLLGLFHLEGMSTKAPEPTLAEMTAKAIEILSEDPDGFFLMSEGGQIDWACHDNNARRTLRQVKMFDDAVGVALDFAEERGDTLVLVTADHESGGLMLVASGNGFHVRWATDGHTATDVPLFAMGPGSSRFTGVMHSRDVARRLAGLWDLPGIPRAE